MTPKEFLRRYRLDGLYLSRNGPRLYLEGGRGFRMQYRNGYLQRCYIDLRTFEAHIITTGPKEEKCAAMNAQVLRPLRVIARLARMVKVRPE